VSGGFKTALDIARDLNGSPEPQGDMFAPGQTPSRQANLPATRAPGRPKGARNLTTKQYSRWLQSYVGDPLLPAMRVAVLDILDETTVQELAKRWGCSRAEAVDRWTRINQGVQDFVHQRQPRAIHLSPGDPQAADDDEFDPVELPRLAPRPGDNARDITDDAN
jgi:hypothetical protein